VNKCKTIFGLPAFFAVTAGVFDQKTSRGLVCQRRYDLHAQPCRRFDNVRLAPVHINWNHAKGRKKVT
jgi:hypothetical protein